MMPSTQVKPLFRLMRSVAFVISALALVWLINFIVTPNTDRDGMWRSYKSLQPNTVDVLLFGTSRIHANINPAVVYNESGITAFDLSGSAQPLQFSLPTMKEALRTQKPQLVLIDVWVMRNAIEEFTPIQRNNNLTHMPFGVAKIEAIRVGDKPSQWVSYLLPVVQYHSGWASFDQGNFNPWKWDEKRHDIFFGYRFMNSSKPLQPKVDVEPVDQKRFNANIEEISAMVKLARESGAQVAFIEPPTQHLNTMDAYIKAVQFELKLRGYGDIATLKFTNGAQAGNIDYTTDFVDHVHMNYQGAEKFSRFLAPKLQQEFNLTTKASATTKSYFVSEYRRYEKMKQKKPIR